jgi:hypothetical protein
MFSETKQLAPIFIDIKREFLYFALTQLLIYKVAATLTLPRLPRCQVFSSIIYYLHRSAFIMPGMLPLVHIYDPPCTQGINN